MKLRLPGSDKNLVTQPIQLENRINSVNFVPQTASSLLCFCKGEESPGNTGHHASEQEGGRKFAVR